MGWMLRKAGIFFLAGLIFSFLIFSPSSAPAQSYPNKPITIYCGFAPGATTDLTSRALAAGAEKILGVPFVVENKPGGDAVVAPALLATKPPDGYTLCSLPSSALVTSPHLLKLAYNPLKDFTYLAWYARYIAGLCVRGDSPIKTIDEFIAYAKANPGLSYGSPGVHSPSRMCVELLAKCKGLTFRHVPTKGGSEFNTLLLGRHTDFVAGSGSHIPFVKQGVFRLLLVYKTDRRDPEYPDIPTLKELGCEDVPPGYYMVIGPRGMPTAISNKLVDTFKKVTEGPDFQKLLAGNNLPFDFKGREELEREIPMQSEWFRNYLKKIGAKVVE